MQGLQELYKKQSPQKLKILREHALIESAVSSTRIEGVEVEKSRIDTLIFGKSSFNRVIRIYLRVPTFQAKTA